MKNGGNIQHLETCGRFQKPLVRDVNPIHDFEAGQPPKKCVGGSLTVSSRTADVEALMTMCMIEAAPRYCCLPSLCVSRN